MIGHVLVNTDEVITNAYTNHHKALDLVGAENSVSDVIALEDGIIELVVSNKTETKIGTRGTASYGNFVKIKHKNGQKTLYAHLQYGSVTPKQGETISKGDKIGTMGATGNAYGVHLHFEVRNEDETRENPYDYLWGQKKIKNEIETLQINSPPEESIIVPEAEALNEQVISEEPVTEVKAKKENINTEVIAEKQREVIEGISEKTNEKQVSIKKSNQSISQSSLSNYLSNETYNWYSIVDALKEIKVDSSFSNREKIALKNNISNYKGTASQNLQLLSLLKEGKLLNV